MALPTAGELRLGFEERRIVSVRPSTPGFEEADAHEKVELVGVTGLVEANCGRSRRPEEIERIRAATVARPTFAFRAAASRRARGANPERARSRSRWEHGHAHARAAQARRRSTRSSAAGAHGALPACPQPARCFPSGPTSSWLIELGRGARRLLLRLPRARWQPAIPARAARDYVRARAPGLKLTGLKGVCAQGAAGRDVRLGRAARRDRVPGAGRALRPWPRAWRRHRGPRGSPPLPNARRTIYGAGKCSSRSSPGVYLPGTVRHPPSRILVVVTDDGKPRC